MQQKRLIFALLISTAILFAWSFLVPKPPAPAPPPSAQATPQQTVTPAASPGAAATPLPVSSPAATANTTPHRVISVKTPLYEAKLDSLGGEAISWIIKKNKDSGQDIYSVAGDKKTHIPLELVSQEGLKRQPRDARFSCLCRMLRSTRS
jgi:YidC/Oxa1 family membrane protein insertase